MLPLDGHKNTARCLNQLKLRYCQYQKLQNVTSNPQIQKASIVRSKTWGLGSQREEETLKISLAGVCPCKQKLEHISATASNPKESFGVI